MKRCFLICAVLLTGIFLAGNGLCATYDATGEWNYTDYNHSNTCGEPNRPTEKGTEIIIQNGNKFTIILSDSSFSGTVNGNVYTGTEKWWEDGGQVTVIYRITASSSTKASGRADWTWAGGGESCTGSFNISMTRRAQNKPTYDATGIWDYSNWGHWSTCGTPDPNETRTATVTQTGNRITLVDDLQRTNYGFVDAVKYTFARSFPNQGGTTSVVHRVTLAAGGTSGTGIGEFVWDDDYDDCQGGFNFSIEKQQQTFTISGTVSQLQGVLMTLSGDAGGTTTTNASGNYSFGNLTNGNYTITPTMEGYRFEPASRNVTINNGDKTGIDFVAHQMARAMPWLSLLLDEGGATVVSAYQEGDFWEYRWDAKKTISDRDGTRTTRDSGSFAVVLGSPRQIKGITTNEVLVTGDSIPDKVSTSWDFAPRWRYIAKVGKKILGSEDGITLKTIFDGQTGQWYGGGFFVSFAEDKLITAVPGEIDNDYLKSSALTVGDETSQSHCDWVAGKWICPNEDSYNRRTNEYYIENVDPVGLYHNNYAYFGGTFPQAFRWIYNVGLVSSSFWGAPRRSIISEVEPNNYQSDAQAVDIPSFASGDVSVGSGYKMGISCDYPPTNVEDWYKFTLSQNANVTIRLTFGVQADLDLFLMNDTPGSHGYKIESPFGTLCSSYHDGYSLLAMSIDDNVALGTLTEEIVVTLDAGNYFVGVDAFANPNNGAIDYILEFNAQ